MLALRKTRPAFGAELLDLARPEEPKPPPGEAVVRVAAAGICGSDLHAYEWSSGYDFMTARLPLTLGHEFAGTIVALGAGKQPFSIGNRVVCWPTITCGDCTACREGKPGRCIARQVIGLHRDGGFAPYVVVPTSTLRLVPDDLPSERAALTEPLAVSVHAVDLADVTPGDRLVVLGPGPIGLSAAWIAQARGAKVLVAGYDDATRLAVAAKLGITHRADLAEVSLSEAVSRAFGGPADSVIEATGAAIAVEQGLAVLRPEGVLVVAGIHAKPLTFDLTRFVREKKQLRGAHDTTETAFAEAIGHLARAGKTLDCLITHRLPLSRALEAMEIARARRSVKVLLYPENCP